MNCGPRTGVIEAVSPSELDFIKGRVTGVIALLRPKYSNNIGLGVKPSLMVTSFFQGHGHHLQFINSCIEENVMLNFIRAEDASVLPVHDSFIMHYAYGELGELEEEMRRSFHGHFKKDINVKSEIGVMLPSSFDGREWSDFTFEKQIHGPPEYSQWEDRNS